ncbi:vesicular transport protein [Blumeria hordei DH14]|uniref:Vesicular transport protein n=1 Tax=Blumeria graminis f. sp. hordei (strain DH14) TaxID=546991 RepID=N1JFN6_BLUG1|nr:vesicular transport protein [Blumeria hordei DH14]
MKCSRNAIQPCAIDSRIAEEQARQKALAGSPVSRSASSSSKSGSIKKEIASKSKRDRRQEDSVNSRGPDPSEFDHAFIIEDEDDEANKETVPGDTPHQRNNSSEFKSPETETLDKESSKLVASPNPEITPTVRMKLRKLERLETRYQELLRSYRVAHARAISIESFEKQLRENTPLSTISDPDALGEYLNQLNLKGEILMEELKRVTTDRDEFKNKVATLEHEVLTSKKELVAENQNSAQEESEMNEIPRTGVVTLIESDKPSVSTDVTVFSPSGQVKFDKDQSSYELSLTSSDNLQKKLEEKSAEVEILKSRVEELEKYLPTAQDPNQNLASSSNNEIQESNVDKDAIFNDQSSKDKIDVQEIEIQELKNKIESTESRFNDLIFNLESQKKDAEERLFNIQAEFAKQEESSSTALISMSNTSSSSSSNSEELINQKKKFEQLEEEYKARIEALSTELQQKSSLLQSKNSGEEVTVDSNLNTVVPSVAGPSKTSKKRNKKKKNLSNLPPALSEIDCRSESIPNTPKTSNTENDLIKLQSELQERDLLITQLQSKRKTEEDLREELENTQESLLSIGQEHVMAKESIKSLNEEKKKLQEEVSSLEKDLNLSRIEIENSKSTSTKIKELSLEYEDIKIKSATLQTDLIVTQQLAASRYKDLTDLRETHQKAQQEVAKLRTENKALKSAKEELVTSNLDLRRLQIREKDLKSEVTSFKKQVNDFQSEIRTLNEKIGQENATRLRAEDHQRVAQRDMRKSEAEKVKISAALEKSSSELVKSREETISLQSQVKDLEEQVLKLSSESKKFREEAEIQSSLLSNLENSVESMKGQASEMAMQLREAQTQSESLSEELAEAHRLLSERTREGETMRRLLADVDERADARVREMQEQMEMAKKERDQLEDESSNIGRRRAREIEELKVRHRDLDRDLKSITSEKERLQNAENTWKHKYEELEQISQNSKKEAEGIRIALNQLQDALNRSEKAVREAEKQRQETTRLLDDVNQRFEKAKKENQTLQSKLARFDENRRDSTDNRTYGATKNDAILDFVYLKTIILQFLEQRDRKVQESLVKTVLGQLLKIDKSEQDRWIAAIIAK